MPPAGELAGLAMVGAATGERLGRLQDVPVDEAAESVVALVLSAGFVGDLLHGRPRTLPLSLVRAIGPDSVVAAPGYDPKTAGTHPRLRAIAALLS